MKIFYAHSTNKESIYQTYEKVCNEINKKNDIIIDVENKNNSILLEKITESINECDLFICDITPDYDYENKTFVNSNVMLELGYAIQKINKNNIILILDTKVSTNDKIPSLIKRYHYISYEYECKDDSDYYMVIVDEINKRINENNEYSKNLGWETYDYKLSNKLRDELIKLNGTLSGIKKIGYTIRINKKNKKVVILFGCDGSWGDKIIDLSYNNETLYNELKHLEILAHANWFMN